MIPQLRLTLLGTFQATQGDQVVQGFVSSKAQALLAHLAMADHPQPRSILAALLWGDMPDAEARTSLRKALSNLRQLLGPYLLIDRHEVQMNFRSPYWVDALAFQQEAHDLLLRCEPGSGSMDDSALARLQACADGYTGEFLAGLHLRDAVGFEDWLLLQRERLHQLAGQVMFNLSAQLATRRRYAEALKFSERLLELDSWNEDAHRQRILLLANNGQHSAALHQYETCRRILEHELGVSPSAETQALIERLKRNQSIPSNLFGALETGAPHRMPFAGREMEHAWLMQRWNRSRRWQGSLTLVAGEAGVGKTRLVQQVLEQVALQGGIVLAGRCYEFNRAIPYQAIHNALHNYAEHLPPKERSNTTEDWLLNIERMLATAHQIWPHGMALFLDDLQWADTDTLDLLHYLVRRLAHEPCWLIGAYRPEETPTEHPLRRLIRSLDANGLVHHLSLQALPQTAVAYLTQALFGNHTQVNLAQTLFEESQGNPFLLNELVALLQDNNVFQHPDASLEELNLPTMLSERVQTVIQQRIEQLDENSQYLLMLAAALGQPFSLGLLQAAGQCSTETVQQAVEEWIRRRLVQPDGKNLDFTHDKIRSVLYLSVPAALRRLLHARLGAALENAEPVRAIQQKEMLAHHFDHAHDWPKALHYLKLAGEQAEHVYANEQAQEHYRRALNILRQHLAATTDAARQEYHLWCRLERLYDLQGQRSEQQDALQTLGRLVGLAEDAPPHALSDPLLQIEVWLRQSHHAEAVSDYAAAARAAQSAVALAEAASQPGMAAAGYRYWAYAMRRQGKISLADELYHKALQIAEAAEHWPVVSDCLQGLANIARDRQQFEPALAYLARSMQICQASADQRSISDAYNIQGLVYRQQGDHDRSAGCFEQSLLIRREIGDRRGMALTLNNLGSLAFMRDEVVRAREFYGQALDLSIIVGDQQGQAVSHHGLFQVCHRQEDGETACRHAWQALRLYRKISDRPAARRLLKQMRAARF